MATNGFRKSFVAFCKSLASDHFGPVEVFGDAVPVLTAPDPQAVAQSLAKLDSVRKHTGTAMGIAPADAEIILQHVVARTRANLSRKLSSNGQDPIEINPLVGECELASDLAHAALGQLGQSSQLIQIENLLAKNHKVLIVTLPVTSDTGVLAKDYLVDTTYRQFCTVTNTEPSIFFPLPMQLKATTGYRLSQSEEGRKLGTQLLTHGYAELTAQNAKLYLDSFNGEGHTLPEAPACVEFLRSADVKPCYSADYLRNTGYEIDFIAPQTAPSWLPQQVRKLAVRAQNPDRDKRSL